jgi:hypothetical protein
VVGFSCAITFLIIMALRGKPYYAGPLFPTLFAAGAVVVGRLISRVDSPMPRYAAALGTLTLVGLWGLALLPLSVPIYSPEETARFAATTGSAPTTNQGEANALPQDFADMLGWEEKVERVADVYHALPPHDRADAVIITSNYGQAGAIRGRFFWSIISMLPPRAETCSSRSSTPSATATVGTNLAPASRPAGNPAAETATWSSGALSSACRALAVRATGRPQYVERPVDGLSHSTS